MDLDNIYLHMSASPKHLIYAFNHPNMDGDKDMWIENVKRYVHNNKDSCKHVEGHSFKLLVVKPTDTFLKEKMYSENYNTEDYAVIFNKSENILLHQDIKELLKEEKDDAFVVAYIDHLGHEKPLDVVSDACRMFLHTVLVMFVFFALCSFWL